jgi:hypothetical protein
MDGIFTATIITEEAKGGWTYIIWPDSASYLGTGKAAKVEGTMDGHDFQATFLPWGDGTHMLPIKASLMKLLKKQAGDSVEVRVTKKPEASVKTKAKP